MKTTNKGKLTVDARTLAEIFQMTPRNISHMVDQGMPVYRRGKAGKGHVFIFPFAMYWHVGSHACRSWGKDIPDTLSTVLTGYAIDKGSPDYTFEGWMKKAKALAADMGYAAPAFDKSVQNLIARNLIRFGK